MSAPALDAALAAWLAISLLIAGAILLLVREARRELRNEERELIAERMKVYDEEIYRDCTVIVWKDDETGERITTWWPNGEGGGDAGPV